MVNKNANERISLYSDNTDTRDWFMTQNQTLLYPKLSSSYNKILQLAIAIVFLLVTLNMWVVSYVDEKQHIKQQLKDVATSHTQMIANSSIRLWDEKPENFQEFIDETALLPWVQDISVYQQTGQLRYASSRQVPVKTLYGFDQQFEDVSGEYTTVVLPIEKLGYVRVTAVNSAFIASLTDAAEQQHTDFRIMLILAGIVGFLLTRGFNRFSRQSFRLAKK